MANATAILKELRIVLEDELTQVYVYYDVEDDAPIGVMGWHHKTFPASKNAVEIINSFVDDSPMLWGLQSPERPR